MKNEILKLLEEKLNKEFKGTTGTDLKRFLEENSLVLLANYADANLLMSDGFSAPDKYFLSMEAKCAHLLDDGFHYEETVSDDDKVYYSVKEMVAAGDEMPMIYGYLESIAEGFGFFQMVERVHNICKENNANALLEFVEPSGDGIDLTVEFNGEEIKYNGNIVIVNDSADELLQSFMWIAYRLNDGDLNEYLALFGLNVVEKKEVNGINERLAKTVVCNSKQEIIDQITKTPRSIENYLNNKEIISDEEVMIAFIRSNDKYVRSITQDAHHSNGLKFFSQTLYVKKTDEYLNGVPSIPSEISEILFDEEYLLSHLSVLEELCKTSMVKYLVISDEWINLFTFFFVKNPALIIPITSYYERKYENDKNARESFLKVNKLAEKTNNFTLSILKAIELIKHHNIEGYLYLLDTNFEYYDTAVKYCEDLPMDIKRKLISKNYFLMKYFKNDFSFDDPLVIEIINNCHIATSLINDEAIIKNKIEQVRKLNCYNCANTCNNN